MPATQTHAMHALRSATTGATATAWLHLAAASRRDTVARAGSTRLQPPVCFPRGTSAVTMGTNEVCDGGWCSRADTTAVAPAACRGTAAVTLVGTSTTYWRGCGMPCLSGDGLPSSVAVTYCV